MNSIHEKRATLEMPLSQEVGGLAQPWNGSRSIRVAFITNFCPHYRVKTFELLANRFDVTFLFYSDGREWYWPLRHGTSRGDFNHQYLPGMRFLGTRIVPSLPWKLWNSEYDVILKCIDGRFALAAAYFSALVRRRPFILWTGIWSAIETPFHRLAAPLLHWIYRNSSAIVVYGEHVKKFLVGLGIKGEKIFIAAHAVENEVYSQPIPAEEVNKLRCRLRLGPTDPVILYLGRLEKSKGISYLIEAFREVPEPAVLVIAGDGSERPALESDAANCGLKDRVRFVGYVPPRETLPYYAMAHALVLPSITTSQGKEPWGLVVNEAMNQGIPVIVTEAVGAAAGGLVRDEINGFVVAERDTAALSRVIRKIVVSPRLRGKLSENARRIITEWNNEQMVRGFERAILYAVHKDDPVLTS